MSKHHISMFRIVLSVPMLTLAGCDPVVNIAGANFPGWLLCAISGAILTAMFRPIFAATRVEAYLGPLLVIYPCLGVLLACLIYLILFSRI
jgi:hypothetical protein